MRRSPPDLDMEEPPAVPAAAAKSRAAPKKNAAGAVRAAELVLPKAFLVNAPLADTVWVECLPSPIVEQFGLALVLVEDVLDIVGCVLHTRLRSQDLPAGFRHRARPARGWGQVR